MLELLTEFGNYKEKKQYLTMQCFKGGDLFLETIQLSADNYDVLKHKAEEKLTISTENIEELGSSKDNIWSLKNKLKTL